jgi:hypothetical protein
LKEETMTGIFLVADILTQKTKSLLLFFISTLKQIYETCDGYDNADKNDFSIFLLQLNKLSPSVRATVGVILIESQR